MAYNSKFTGAQIDDLLDKSKTMGAAVDELAQDVAVKEDAANKVTSITASADDTHYPSAKAVKTALTHLADGEDLASVGDVMKLADKTYDPITYSGMGRKYLRKNLVGGKNILTQEMLPSANTIYIIQYNYDLNGATINVPGNCTLDFQGGSLGNGTLKGNNSIVTAANTQIFHSDLDISGNWKINEWNIMWFGAKGDGVTDDTDVIIRASKIKYATIFFPTGIYVISSTIDGYETSQAWIGNDFATTMRYSAQQTIDQSSSFKCVGENGGEPFVYCPKVFKNFGIFGERASTTTPLYENTIGIRMNKTKQFTNQIVVDNIYIAYFGTGMLATTGFSNRINQMRIDRCYIGLDLSSEVFKGVDSGYITIMHISNYAIDNCITAAIYRGILGDDWSSICNVEFSHGTIEANGAPMIQTPLDRTQGGNFIFNYLYSEETDAFCDVRGLSIRLINSNLRTNSIKVDYGILWMINTIAARAKVQVDNYELNAIYSSVKELVLPVNRPGRSVDSQIKGLLVNGTDFNLYKLPVVTDFAQTRPFGFGSQNQGAGVMGFDLTNNLPVVWINNTNKWRDVLGFTPSAKSGETRPTLKADDIGKQFFDITLNKPIWWNGSAWVDATGQEV